MFGLFRVISLALALQTILALEDGPQILTTMREEHSVSPGRSVIVLKVNGINPGMNGVAPFAGLMNTFLHNEMNQFFSQVHHHPHFKFNHLRGGDGPSMIFGSPVMSPTFQMQRPLTHFSFMLPPLIHGSPFKRHHAKVTVHACHDDALMMCNDAHKQKRFVAVMACLQRNEHSMSAPCKLAMQGSPSFECAVDVSTRCPLASKKEDVTNCLLLNKDMLSPRCQDAIHSVHQKRSTMPANHFVTKIVRNDDMHIATPAAFAASKDVMPSMPLTQSSHQSAADRNLEALLHNAEMLHTASMHNEALLHKEEKAHAATTSLLTQTSDVSHAEGKLATPVLATASSSHAPSTTLSDARAANSGWMQNMLPWLIVAAAIFLVVGIAVCLSCKSTSSGDKYYEDRDVGHKKSVQRAPHISDDIMNSDVEYAYFSQDYSDK